MIIIAPSFLRVGNLQHGDNSHGDGTSGTEGREARCGTLEVGWEWWGGGDGRDNATSSGWEGGGWAELGGGWAHGAHGRVLGNDDGRFLGNDDGRAGSGLGGGGDQRGDGGDLGDADGAGQGLGGGGDDGGGWVRILCDGEAEEAKEDGEEVDELHFDNVFGFWIV